MKPELERKLIEDFPTLFRGVNKPITDSLMAFGCECGDGWYNLIYAMCQEITAADPEAELLQVKEKRGLLRACLDHENWDKYEQVNEIMNNYERLSAETCERCGEPGERRLGGWIKTLCDVCFVDKG